MANIYEITCYNCQRKWQVDLDEHQDRTVIYKSAPPTKEATSYEFSCPRCGKSNVFELSEEAGDDG